ncbi:MFS transporter [Thermus filiformis]|uniref:Multidrug transporter n=1 Tax=Thermus filiformis TaxID=276 RepID=A0A0D6XB89_THEFI|nr:MFS transporter [Thermus filiformis]KIX84591.1 multidrug transporter [Thermus filiformis]
MGPLVLLSGVALYSAFYSVVPLLPALERLFGAPPGSAGPGMGLPLLLLVLASPWVPRLPVRPGLVLGSGLLLVGLGGVAGALAPGLGAWLLARLLQGLGVALVPGLSLALIPHLFPQRRLEMAGLYMAGNVLGGGLGRVLAGVLSEGLGVRPALLLLSLPSLLLGPLLLRVHAPLPQTPPRYDLRALPLYLLGFILLFLNLFLANLLPYRLEALGYGPAQVGLSYLAYLFGLPGSALSGFLAARLGYLRALRLAFLGVVLGVLAQLFDPPVLGFVLMMAALFPAQSLVAARAGQLGSGVSATYVAAFYLGGTAAGLLYPLFLPHLPLALLLALALAASALLLSSRIP